MFPSRPRECQSEVELNFCDDLALTLVEVATKNIRHAASLTGAIKDPQFVHVVRESINGLPSRSDTGAAHLQFRSFRRELSWEFQMQMPHWNPRSSRDPFDCEVRIRVCGTGLRTSESGCRASGGATAQFAANASASSRVG
jgi:hypothetical protein